MDRWHWDGRTFVGVGEAPLKSLVPDLFFRHPVTPLSGFSYQDYDGVYPVTEFMWISNPFRNIGWWVFIVVATNGDQRRYVLDEHTRFML